MTLVETFVHTQWAAALGSALLHFLWQGALAAVLLAVLLRGTRPSSARLRYALACLTLLALPVVFGVTFRIALAGPVRYPLLVHPGFPQPADLPAVSSASPLPGGTWARGLPWLAPFWMAGVALLYLRSLGCWLAAQRLRRVGVCCAAADWQDRLLRLQQRLRITRPVLLLESCFAEVPSVVGFLRPAILMPLGLLSGFPAEQVEAFLLHELAHIRRYDYLVNLMQNLVENLLFYHPAVWWISRQVRAERENCCDDMVVAQTGDIHGYATALTTFETKRWTADGVLAATGGNLMQRIHRLLGKPQPKSAGAPAIVLLLVCAAAALAAWSPKPAPQAVPPAALPNPARPARLVAPAQTPQAAPLPDNRQQKQLKDDVLYIITPEQRAAFQRLQTEEQRAQFVEQLRLVAQAQPPRAQALPRPETPYEKWVNQDVTYIITPEERTAFQSLASDEERDHFIEQFWLRRDPTPGTERNEVKEEHYRRIGYANGRFTAAGVPGWKTDRGRIYITFGPPDEMDSHPSGGAYERPPAEGGGQITTVPFEDWRYRYIEGVGNDVVMEFVDSAGNGLYRMTKDPSEKDSIRYVPGNAPVRPARPQ